MESTEIIELDITPAQQGTYFTVSFVVPANTGRLHVSYDYPRYDQDVNENQIGTFVAQPEINIIDLGLISPNGKQVGASGSDKKDFFVTENNATPGYNPTKLVAGEWMIMVGAYKIAPQGCHVFYEIELFEKEESYLKGDLHTHTLASDGVYTVAELAYKAMGSGLNFLAITDHNQMVSKASFPEIQGLTLIPGIEWTHYQGHANFLGLDQPYDEPFATNTFEEASSKFQSARQRGALISINHPFDELCGFQFDLTKLPFDCIEVWNGPMRESNIRAVGFWHNMLVSGKKIPMCGGSDYHRDTPFIFLGGPTTTVLAWSSSPDDILDAVRKGISYLAFAPNAPVLEFSAGDIHLGGTVKWKDEKEAHVKVDGLLSGDVVRVITNTNADVILQAPNRGNLDVHYPMKSPGFARIEILRAFLPGLPMLPALLSNPIYFES
ncbi:MAG: hypothetical protein CVU46_17020 [Chloroflexi bacterium HGW-Chloroflexi-8]|nr:MAG: hypothetical protein CVU46_17020 [Chloroflexi bacterium HGW-Chloroflexi-8]